MLVPVYNLCCSSFDVTGTSEIADQMWPFHILGYQSASAGLHALVFWHVRRERGYVPSAAELRLLGEHYTVNIRLNLVNGT